MERTTNNQWPAAFLFDRWMTPIMVTGHILCLISLLLNHSFELNLSIAYACPYLNSLVWNMYTLFIVSSGQSKKKQYLKMAEEAVPKNNAQTRRVQRLITMHLYTWPKIIHSNEDTACNSKQ